MATKKGQPRKTARRAYAPKAARRSGTKRSYASRAKSGFKSITKKINWGEAALFAGLGYEMGNVLQGTGIPYMLGGKYPGIMNYVNASSAANTGDFINKLIGAGAGVKVLADGAEGKVDSKDLSIYLPYTIGSVFDPNKKSFSSNNNERW